MKIKFQELTCDRHILQMRRQARQAGLKLTLEKTGKK